MQASPLAKDSGLRALLCAALTALLLVACQAQTPEEASSEIAQARQRWVATGIHDYQFTLSRVCFCASEEAMRIVVKNDRVTSVHYTPSGQAVNAQRLKSLPTSINALFDAMQSNYAQPQHKVTWQLNKDYPYPEEVRIDEDVSIPDAHVSYTIGDFSH
jgi:hypothetical protein